MKNLSDKHIKEIKKWLNIDTYRQFENIPLERLYHELVMRSLFFKSDNANTEFMLAEIYATSLFSGKPFLITDSHMARLAADDMLSPSPHFSITTTGRLADLCIYGMEKSLFGLHDDEYWVDKKIYNIPIAETMPVLFQHSVMIEIDLTAGTDEEIAESLKALLPQWRKIRGIEPEPSDSVRFGYGTIKKIINYRLLPILDILIWAKRNDIRVSDDRLSTLLHSDTDEEDKTRSGSRIKDTDKPLAIKTVSKSFILQFHHFLNKNPDLRDTKVSEVMKRADKEADKEKN
ncbi:DUF6387 family protein [Pectobacterium brasiliense]|uniref:DUF6387 family protein n=1 Tax=Pectobacterium brasiliense TaxID=180957 RepID=UPI001968F76F|nr:DUF6387 family protein [Pectobacterium brasiliense]MBN3055185.1 hypothetical protein [Pectobacterium brasiliense]